MKVEAECAACILSRATAESVAATTNPALRFRVAVDLLRLMAKEFRPTAVPADLGTKRDRLVKRITGNEDPYKRIKEKSNEKALDLLPFAKEFVEEGYSQLGRLRKACLCAIVGNTMEFDILGHKFTFRGLRKDLKDSAKDLVLDDTSRIYELAMKARTVLYLTDNSGEIVFDTLLVEQLKNMGLTVIACVKGKPIVNDATLEDAKVSGMSSAADRVITTGTDAVGLAMKEVSKEFLDAYASADLIFAKGMGHAETLTEYKIRKPHVLLFRAKCNPVANFFCVPREKNVAKLIY